jgi:hypothetical protein
VAGNLNIANVPCAAVDGGGIVRRLLLLGLTAAVAAAGCASAPALTAQRSDTEAITTLFPLISDLGVDAFWVDAFGCRYLHYSRGSFSTDTRPNGGCRVWAFPDPVPFDGQAAADIDRLIGAIRDAHVAVSYFSIQPDGARPAVGRGSYFDIGPCDSLVFDPGYGALPTPDGTPDQEVIGPVTADWYETSSSC